MELRQYGVRPEHDIRRESVEFIFSGHTDKAKQSALAAKTAYRAVKRFLPKLGVEGEQQERIDTKLANLTPLIEKLSEIR
jgi:hypothetical protein